MTLLKRLSFSKLFVFVLLLLLLIGLPMLDARRCVRLVFCRTVVVSGMNQDACSDPQRMSGTNREGVQRSLPRPHLPRP